MLLFFLRWRLVHLVGSKYLTMFRDMIGGWATLAMLTTPLLSMKMWRLTRVSQNIKHCYLRDDTMAFSDNLLWGSTFDAFKISKGCLLIVQAKFYHGTKETLDSYSPEAVSHAIALLKSEKYNQPCLLYFIIWKKMPFSLPEVRFCISNGQYWNFFILKLEDGKLISRESTVYKLSKEALEHSDLPLREIMLLICEWVSFFVNSCIYLWNK